MCSPARETLRTKGRTLLKASSPCDALPAPTTASRTVPPKYPRASASATAVEPDKPSASKVPRPARTQKVRESNPFLCSYPVLPSVSVRFGRGLVDVGCYSCYRMLQNSIVECCICYRMLHTQNVSRVVVVECYICYNCYKMLQNSSCRMLHLLQNVTHHS